MKIDEQLIRAVTAAVVEQLQKNGQLHLDTVEIQQTTKKGKTCRKNTDEGKAFL